MYSFYIISYKGKRSEDVKSLVKGLVSWFNIFEDQYLVCSSLNMEQIKRQVERGVDRRNDAYLILKINIEDKSGQLPQKAWEWIRTQEQKISRDENFNNFIS